MDTLKRHTKMALLALLLLLLPAVSRAQDDICYLPHLTYEVWYAQALHCPVAVQWNLTAADLGSASTLPHRSFVADQHAPKPRVKSKHYTLSGYHRGHICPAADRGATYEGWADTFVMTNVAPMVPQLNTGAWKCTEDECREMVKTGCALTIFAAPLWLDTIMVSFSDLSIVVPSHFVKRATCTTHDGHTLRWCLSNQAVRQNIADCLISEDSMTTLILRSYDTWQRRNRCPEASATTTP